MKQKPQPNESLRETYCAVLRRYVRELEAAGVTSANITMSVEDIRNLVAWLESAPEATNERQNGDRQCSRSLGRNGRCPSPAVNEVETVFHTVDHPKPMSYWSPTCARHTPSDRNVRAMSEKRSDARSPDVH